MIKTSNKLLLIHALNKKCFIYQKFLQSLRECFDILTFASNYHVLYDSDKLAACVIQNRTGLTTDENRPTSSL